MPIEVIDLLSSPDIPRRYPAAPTSEKPALVALPPERARAYQVPDSIPTDDGWFILSSEGNEPDLPGHSTIDTASHVRLVTSPRSKLSRASKPPQSKPKVDFFFLSDDFDTTVDLDASYALDEPLAKKRRLSSSPQPTLPKTGLSRAKEFKRSVSNIETSKSKPTRTGPALPLKKSNITSIVLDSDPIVFTSSPDPFADTSKRRKYNGSKDWEDAVDEDIFGFDVSATDKGRVNCTVKSNDAGILQPRYGNSTREVAIEYSDDDLPDVFSLPVQATKYSRSSEAALAMYNEAKLTKKVDENKPSRAQGCRATGGITKEPKRLDKEAEKKEKLLAKEALKKQKLLDKEERIRKKEKAADFAKVNTLRTDKKVSTPEMIVELSSSLDAELARQVRSFSTPLQVDTEDFESPLPIIRWKRKVEAKYNDELGYWEPTPLHIKPENHIICVISGQEFVDLVMGGEANDIDSHVLRLRAKFPSNHIIYLMEGLASWMRKNKTLKNRRFDQAVRSQMGEEDTSTRRRAKKGKSPEHVDEDMVEDALLRLQVVHNTLVHHTAALIETAQWITTFTQHISTIPYRAQKESLDTAFCMETGQVKTGEDPKDTFTKMLQEIIRVTQPIAYGIASEYPSVQQLVRGIEKGGPLVLEDLRKSANKDGAVTDRRIGPSISKRVYSIFMGRDPGSWDV